MLSRSLFKIFAFGTLVAALPAESPKDILAKLEGRKATCNADLCLGMLTNRPAPATAYCTALLGQTPGTVTITSWISSTVSPSPSTTTELVGTTIETDIISSTYTSDQTVFFKRTASIPISSLVPLSCTSSQNAPVTYRASSACSCLLSTSATVTVTSTAVSTASILAVTETTVYASTSTVSITEAVATTISTISCGNLISDPSFENATPSLQGPIPQPGDWSSSSVNVFVEQDSDFTPYGQNLVFLHYWYGSQTGASLMQTVNGLVTGSQYTLTYYYWLRSWYGLSASTSVCTLTTQIGALSIDTLTFTAQPNADVPHSGSAPYATRSINFTAPAGTSQILTIILSCQWPSGDEWGAIVYMDNFSLEPTTCIDN